MGEEDKPVGKGTGGFADAGDEKSQEERLAALEARLTALEDKLASAE